MAPPSILSPPESSVRSLSWSSQMPSCSRCGPAREGPQEETKGVNARLVEELRSVVVMNDKWQKYHLQQKRYISELQESLDDQKSRTKDAEKRYSQLLITQRLQVGKIAELEETIGCFTAALEEADEARCARERLEEEVRELKRLQDSSSPEENERIQLLQLQLQVCIDDFQKEEAEKIILQNEVSSLSEKMADSNRIIREYREKVGVMQAIHFPSFNHGDMANAIPKDNLTLHRRRNRVSTSAPSKSGMSCRLDGMLKFPSTIEADSSSRTQKGFQVPHKFSTSMGSDDTFVNERDSDHDSLETNVELVRH